MTEAPETMPASRQKARRLFANPMAAARAAVLLALAIGAALTPGFISLPSLNTLLTTASFVGCLAAAMTFITVSGNVMSFALGATAAACAVVFMAVMNGFGLAPAIIAALLTGAAITGLQGFIIAYLRANPIIVTIAASVLIYGVANWFTSNATINGTPDAVHRLIRGKILGVPLEFVVFVGVILVGQIIMSFTVFGRNLLLIGSGFKAAEAIGLPTTRAITGAYMWAGLFAAVSGILLASRYTQANMGFALNYDYDAIAAVLVGGTAIQGGDGSMFRTFIGVIAISVIEVVLLLFGFRAEWRYLITGIVVLLVVILYSKRQVG